jgi:hypothetical protein
MQGSKSVKSVAAAAQASKQKKTMQKIKIIGSRRVGD